MTLGCTIRMQRIIFSIFLFFFLPSPQSCLISILNVYLYTLFSTLLALGCVSHLQPSEGGHLQPLIIPYALYHEM